MGRIAALISYAVRDASRSRTVLALITISLSISSAAVLATTAVLDGFKGALTEGAIYSDGHLTISPKDFNIPSIEDADYILEELKKIENIESMSLRSTALGGINSNGNLVAAYSMMGVSENYEKAATKIPERVIEGRFLVPNQKNEIVLGISLADALVGLENDKERLKAGEKVEVIFYNGERVKYDVVGILDAKTFYPNWKVFFNKEELERVDPSKMNNEIAIKLKDGSKLQETKAEILSKNLNIGVSTWEEKAAYINDINSAVSFITTTISRLLIVAVFVIISIVVFINVSQKKRQIGIMKSMGANKRFIVSIFAIQTVVYSIMAFKIGFLIFMIIHLYSESHPIPLLIGDFHTVLNQRHITETMIILFVAAITGSLLPGYLAAKTKIADIIIDRN